LLECVDINDQISGTCHEICLESQRIATNAVINYQGTYFSRWNNLW